MARQLRLEYSGALYHLTARGNDQHNIFHDETDRQHFLTLFGREILQQGWRCYAYCLMGNHYHLLLETPEPNLSHGMRRLNGSYTQRFNWRYQRVGHLLQGRFKSLLVKRESYLLELCRYVVLNPVRAGMVVAPQEWSWSSYRATVGSDALPPWLDVGVCLRCSIRIRTGRGRPITTSWRMASVHPHGLRSPARFSLGARPFGNAWLRFCQANDLRMSPWHKPIRCGLEPNEIQTRVDTVYGISTTELVKCSHRETYYTAVWVLRRAGNDPLNMIAVRFGVFASRVSKIQNAIESRPLTP